MLAGGAFSLGFWARGKFENLNLPKLRLGTGSSTSSDGFRLVVRVHEASVPALASPGLVTISRPRLEVQVGDAIKSTELADFSGSGMFPWRFGDTLTFPMEVRDLSATGGLQLRLSGHSEASLGPVSLVYRNSEDLAEARVDLCRRVLPACVKNADGAWGEEDTAPTWSSPRIPFPLLPLQGTMQSPVEESTPRAIPDAAAHCVLSFEVSADPEALLVAAAERDMPLAEKVERQVERNADNVFRWMHEPVETDAFERLALAAYDVAERRLGGVLSSREGRPACGSTSGGVDGAGGILAPDEQPDGWVWHRSADGRVFWHHMDLGPPPWEVLGKLPSSEYNPSPGPPGVKSTSAAPHATMSSAMPPVKASPAEKAADHDEQVPTPPPPPPLGPPPPEMNRRRNHYA